MNIAYFFLTVYAAFTLLWAVFFFFYAKIWFTKKFQHLNTPLLEQNLLYEGFVRNDIKKWNFCEFYLTGVFLLPIRIILCSICLILIYVNLKIFSLCFYRNPSQPQNAFFFHYTSFVLRFYCRVMMFVMGIFWIKKKKISFDDKKHPNLVPKGNLSES